MMHLILCQSLIRNALSYEIGGVRCSPSGVASGAQPSDFDESLSTSRAAEVEASDSECFDGHYMNRARFEEGLRSSNIPVGYLLALLGHLHTLVNYLLHSRIIRDIDVTPYFQVFVYMNVFIIKRSASIESVYK